MAASAGSPVPKSRNSRCVRPPSMAAASRTPAIGKTGDGPRCLVSRPAIAAEIGKEGAGPRERDKAHHPAEHGRRRPLLQQRDRQDVVEPDRYPEDQHGARHARQSAEERRQRDRHRGDQERRADQHRGPGPAADLGDDQRPHQGAHRDAGEDGAIAVRAEPRVRQRRKRDLGGPRESEVGTARPLFLGGSAWIEPGDHVDHDLDALRARRALATGRPAVLAERSSGLTWSTSFTRPSASCHGSG